MKIHLITTAKKYRLALFTGFLMGTSYIPFPPWALVFCFAPLFVFVVRDSVKLKEVFLAGWIAQFILTILGFHWIALTAKEFGGLPWIVSILVLILFASFVHLYIPISLTLASYLQKKIRLPKFYYFLSCGLFLFLGETYWPSLFQWNLGYPWIWTDLPIYQNADWLGFQGLSLITILSSSIIAYGVVEKKLTQTITVVAIAFLSLNFLGLWRVHTWKNFDTQISVLQIQANIGNVEKIYAEKGKGFQKEILDQHIDLTQKGLLEFPDVDLIIWPETAFQDYLNFAKRERPHPQALMQFLTLIQKDLLTGSYSKNEAPIPSNPFNDTYNALFILPKNGTESEPYHKSELLAFGEYMPLSERFHVLRDIIPFVSNFGRGVGPKTMPYRDLLIGPQICYEGLYPYFSRSLTQQGASLFVNLTNDSWFGKHFEPKQHLYMTLARAIENRRPLIRSTNTGITTAILADGTQLQKSPIHEKWYGQFEIKLKKNPPMTFYSMYGQFLGGFVILLLTAIYLYHFTQGRKNAKRNS